VLDLGGQIGVVDASERDVICARSQGYLAQPVTINRAGLRLLHSQFDGGQPGADCLTPQLRTNGHLATDTKRNLLKSVAVFQHMPKAARKKGEPARPPPASPHGWRIRSN
jgi:hypothetical protein